jgi:hypothetical protein
MPLSRRLEKSRTVPVTLDQAFDAVLTRPLPELFSRRYGVIAPIKAVENQVGEWGNAGQTRTIRLADGTTMQETLTVVDRPHRFAYAIGNITGLMKPLVAVAIGTWTFEPAGTGTRVTWTWDVTPTKGLGRAAMPLFARFWSGYARQALERLEQVLVP